ncbi:NUDIX hydrolase [Natrialbaceae archaeon A-CW3]
MKRQVADGLAGIVPTELADPTLQDSAVVVPIRESDPTEVVFIRRTAYRDEHAGEIGLPGGRADPGDDFPKETARREFSEETGVPQADVELLGRVDDVATETGYRIVPFVGHVDPDATFDPCETEVEELVFVPLEVLREQYDGSDQPKFEYDGATIWGATGQIIGSVVAALEE